MLSDAARTSPPRWFRRLLKSPLAQSTMLVAVGTAGAQFLMLLAIPILTRLYSPEEFGFFGIYGSLLAVLVAAAAWRYEVAVPLPARDDDGMRVAALAAGAVLVTSTLTFVVVVITVPMGVRLWSWAPGVGISLYVLPLGVLLMGWYNVSRQLGVRFQAFPAMAYGKVTQAVVQVTGQLGAGFAGMGVLGLSGGDAIGRGSGGFRLLRSTHHRWSGLAIRPWSEVRKQAIRYRRFPLVSSWSGLINASGPHLPPLMVTVAFGPVTGGIFFIASRIATVPVGLIGSAAADVLTGEAARIHRDTNDGLHRFYRRTFLKSGLIAIVVMGAAAAILTPTLPTILGEQWAGGAIIFLILTPLAAAQLAVAPISSGLLILERQGLQFAWDVVRMIVVVIPFILGYLGYLNVVLAVATYAIGGIAMYLLHVVLIVRTARAEGYRVGMEA